MATRTSVRIAIPILSVATGIHSVPATKRMSDPPGIIGVTKERKYGNAIRLQCKN